MKHISKLCDLANRLDAAGLYTEASQVDEIIKWAIEWDQYDVEDPRMEEERQSWPPFPEGEKVPAFKGSEPEGLEPGSSGEMGSAFNAERVGPGGESEYSEEEEAGFEEEEL